MTERPPAPSRGARLLGGLAGAAVAVGVVTALSRAVGAVRVAVLGQTVGPTCLGDTYVTANQIPNVVFEVVAGGALAGVVVPLLAGPLASGDTATARRTASALLTWSLLLLAPLGLLLALAGRPVMALLLGRDGGGCEVAEQLAVGARMLVVFAPQVLLYGVAVVVGGVLQADRRFLGPALAPLLSSLVVITAYLAFAALAGPGQSLSALSRAEELTLSVGTTLGVAVLALSLLVPLRRTGLGLRPALRFPPGAARRARGLAAAGAAVLAAQQVSLVVALRLLNDAAPPGSVVLFVLATTVFTVPWAVLAVPVATSAFPRLSAQAQAGDSEAYADTLSRAARLVLLVGAVGATALAVVAGPAARVLVLTAPGPGGVEPLADALVAFAPGLVGYGLVALLGRALYARGAARPAAVATAVGWLAVAVADVVLVAVLSREDAVQAVGLGNSVGMTLAGVLLVLAVRSAAGPGALRGLGRVTAAAVPACLAGAAAGWAVVTAAGERGVTGSLVTTVVAGGGVLAVAAGVLVGLDRARPGLLPAGAGARAPGAARDDVDP